MEVDQIGEDFQATAESPCKLSQAAAPRGRAAVGTENKGVINLSDWIIWPGVAAAWNLPSLGLGNMDALGAILK